MSRRADYTGSRRYCFLLRDMKNKEVFSFIHDLYEPGSTAHYYLVCHGEAVARKALSIARRPALSDMGIDCGFLYTASMLHDIGMIFTDAPDLGCSGDAPYILHGVLGAEYLRKRGLESYARAAERHLGMGITAEEVRESKLPLPERDMLPETIEERIICFADKFHSKVPRTLTIEKPLNTILERLPDDGSRQRFLELGLFLHEPGIEEMNTDTP